mmetsp:Transcript_16991/g.39206  ORF Transcript_16991/g.39206 Transcript_16991/m.39206 type:complete len:264 (-) Transcript_16991:473-1264(-)
MACPCLELPHHHYDDEKDDDSDAARAASVVVGHLFVAQRGRGAWQRPLHQNSNDNNDDDNNNNNNNSSHLDDFVPIRAPPRRQQQQQQQHPTPQYTLIQSFEATHGNHGEQEAIAQRALSNNNNDNNANTTTTIRMIRMDSQAKYAMVATGHADVYLRLSRTQRPHENIWDHAAGVILVEEAAAAAAARSTMTMTTMTMTLDLGNGNNGPNESHHDVGVVVVTDRRGRPLDFGTGTAKLVNNDGVVVTTSRGVQQRILEALQQ